MREFVRYTGLLVCIVLLSSCMTRSRMNKLVTKYYAQKDKLILSTPSKEQYEVNFTRLPVVNGYCHSKFKSFFTVPLLVYTFSKERIVCTINPKLVSWELTNILNKELSMEENAERIKGKKIILEWQHLPNTIEHKYVNHYVPMPRSYIDISVTKVDFKADNGKLELICKITDAQGTILKQLTIEETVEPVHIETYFEGRRRDFIWNGLTAMNEHYIAKYNTIVKNIIEEL